jgi:hypothetical protein
MPEPNIDPVLRALRRWKATALVALAALVLSLAGWVATAAVEWQRTRAAQEQVEQAMREVERLRDEGRQAMDRAERALYASQILLAEKAFADGLDKP